MSRTHKLLAVIGMTAALLSGAAVSALGAPPEKVTICHAAGQEGTTKFVTLTLPRNAVYGQAGHFNEDGTTQAGHEADYEGACVAPTTTTTTSAVTTTVAPSSTTTVTVPPSTTTTVLTTTSSSTTTLGTTGTVTTSTTQPRVGSTTTTPTPTTVTVPPEQTTTTMTDSTTTTMDELPNTGPEDLPVPLALALLGAGVTALLFSSWVGRRSGS